MEHKLTRYRDWRPTGFDCKGLGLPDKQDWFVVPVIKTRDSGPRAKSNFECAWSIIEDAAVMDNELSCDSFSFNHWGPGWFEIILVRPGSHCEAAAVKLAERLEDYPVVDEEDYSQREWEEATDNWNSLSLRKRIGLCDEGGVSIFAARHDCIPQDDPGYIFDRVRPQE